MTTLEQSRKERQDLENYAKRARRKQREALCGDPEYGERLQDFIKTLGHFAKLDHAQRLTDYVIGECSRWLRAAPNDIRYEALEACNERIDRIKMRHGLQILSDPLPGEPDDVYRVVKKAMGL